MRANLSVHEPRQPQDADTALAFSMEGHNGVQAGDRPAALTPFAWAPGWNSPQSWNKYTDTVGGHSLGGDAGVRIIEPAANAPKVPVYANHVPAAFKASTAELQVVASQHIFGSEELSAKAVPVQSRIPAAHVALNASDAEVLELAEGALVDVQLDGQTIRLPLQRHADLARGLLAVPVLPGVPFVAAGVQARVAGVSRA